MNQSVTIDPRTIVADVTIEGERVQWIGAEALYREIEANCLGGEDGENAEAAA